MLPQANQVVCKLSPHRIYTDNGPDSNLFGLEPNFGCCTANMHQGWPKFTSHLWMNSPDGGLAAMAYAPCSVKSKVKDKPVQIDVRTDYPFDETIKLQVGVPEAVRFPLFLRIPGWAEAAEIDVGGEKTGPVKAGTFHRIERDWAGTTEVTGRLPMPVRIRSAYHDSVSLERGPLVYALKIGKEWKLLKGQPPFADWELYPTTPWNYALQLDVNQPDKSVRFEKRAVGKQPFSAEGAPVQMTVKGRKVPAWAIEKNAAGPLPQSPVRSNEPMEELTLLPYGCTSLRVTEFPVLGR